MVPPGRFALPHRARGIAGAADLSGVGRDWCRSDYAGMWGGPSLGGRARRAGVHRIAGGAGRNEAGRAMLTRPAGLLA